MLITIVAGARPNFMKVAPIIKAIKTAQELGQTIQYRFRFERELIDHKTDIVIVVGDVTSTMACTIAAKKLCVTVVHVEAG